ncbi:MAG: DUF871 domain-containing protein [Atopobiaceae bacterium]|nr:DUF871 domain-containing protein [Atopobiaceae bacterium]
MATLGVSVYPEMRPMDQICEHLFVAAKHGVTRVFSSMFSMPGTREEVLNTFAQLNDAAHRHGMKVSLDINPDCMQRLGATPSDLSVFANIGADILRMDGAYGEDDNLLMLKNPFGMSIEYNASALEPELIAALVERGAPRERILACHNFYPQRYSGFRWDKFCQVNARLRAAGVRVGAFVASHAPNTHGVWDAACGLPTVEQLRDYPADLQARILVAAGTTDVFFGNAYASDEELAAVRQALTPTEPHYISDMHRIMVNSFASYAGRDLDLSRQVKVRVEPLYDLSDVEKAILFDFFPHVDMGDSSEWIWRSRMPRQFFQEEAIAPRRYPLREFQPGDVVMVNDNYKHYAGEVQVVLRPVNNDGTRNLVGRIDPQEFTLFDVIDKSDIIVFIPARG